MKNCRLDLALPHYYEIELVEELSPSLEGVRQIYFPGAVEQGGKDGLVLKVIPLDAIPWIGIFAFGYDSSKVLTGVFSSPNPRSVCVVAAGQGYIVSADQPRAWEMVQSYPIVDVCLIPEKLLLVFLDFTKLTAYGPKGMIWKTDDISWDGLKITDVSRDYIKGLAWDSPQEREVEFIIDVQTGSYEGGSSPKKYGNP